MTIQQLVDRRLSPEEFEAYTAAPLSDDEREANQRLRDWFCRRYPTPAERLAYVRRAYKRWLRRERPSVSA